MRSMLFFILFSTSLFAQNSSDAPVISPYFSAVIVSDIDVSIAWYSDVLGYEVLNRNEAEHIGLIQANLKTDSSFLELIQLESSLSIEEAIQDYNPLNRIQGLFKIGFRVSDFDAMIEKLYQLEVELLGDVVLDPVTNTRIVIVLDPDGNRVQLFEE